MRDSWCFSAEPILHESVSFLAQSPACMSVTHWGAWHRIREATLTDAGRYGGEGLEEGSEEGGASSVAVDFPSKIPGLS